MYRYLILAALVIIITVGAVVWFVHSSAPAPAGNTTPTPSSPDNSNPSISTSQNGHSKADVQAVYKAAVAAHDIDHTKLYDTSVVGDYALQVWAGDIMGGEALLKFDTAKDTWIIIDPGGGSWSVQGLVSAGVPQDIATALLAGVPH